MFPGDVFVRAGMQDAPEGVGRQPDRMVRHERTKRAHEKRKC